MKRIVGILAIITMLFILTGCKEYEYDSEATECFGIGYSTYENKAFVGEYRYDLAKSNTDIVIPEEYKGIPITKLGGYFGLGVPTPFGIDFVLESLPDYESVVRISSCYEDMVDPTKDEIIYIDFTLLISKNIEVFENTMLDWYRIVEYPIECECDEQSSCEICENEQTRVVAYIPRFYVTCDEANKTFYAKDGKLYLKADNTLVEEISYFDFTVD